MLSMYPFPFDLEACCSELRLFWLKRHSCIAVILNGPFCPEYNGIPNQKRPYFSQFEVFFSKMKEKGCHFFPKEKVQVAFQNPW